MPRINHHVIKKANKLLEELEQKYPGLKSSHKLKDYYSREHEVFFNCETELETCLEQTLNNPHPASFRVFYVTQDKTDESYELLKLGGEAGLEASGKRYIEYVGAEIRD